MAEAEESRLESNSQNPLLINEIAKTLLQFVPLAEIKACRLVSRLWWKESLARWRRTYWLTLSCYDLHTGRQEDDDEELRNVALTSDEIRMRLALNIDIYISLWEDPLDPYKLRTHPFKKLSLFKSRISFDSGENDKLESFFAQTAPALKFLALEKCTFETLEDFRKMVFRFSRNLEYLSLADNLYRGVRLHENQFSNLNLKTLVANEGHVQSRLKYLKLSLSSYNTTPDDASPLTWTEFFAHMPNIQTLELVNLCTAPGRSDDYAPVLDSIEALRRDCGILKTLTGLDILNLEKLSTAKYDRYLFIILSIILPSLTFLACDIGYDPDNELADPSELLEIGAATLETLVVYKGPFRNPYGSFPYGNRYPNLTTLTLVGPIVNDLRFLEEIPNLRVLHLFQKTKYEGHDAAIPLPKVLAQLHQFKKNDAEHIEEERLPEVRVIVNTDFSQMSHLTFPNIEEFLVGQEMCSAVHVEELARLMPNVKRLRIGLNSVSFRAVCRYWKGLEALDIFPVLVGEEGITGLVPGEEIRLPNITDLKCLRAFGMGCGFLTNTTPKCTELTDFSFEQGILQLKCLERLVLWCSYEEMSDENYKKLKSMFPPYPYSVIKRASLIWGIDEDV